jgi:hypothetical protein
VTLLRYAAPVVATGAGWTALVLAFANLAFDAIEIAMADDLCVLDREPAAVLLTLKRAERPLTVEQIQGGLLWLEVRMGLRETQKVLDSLCEQPSTRGQPVALVRQLKSGKWQSLC